jgi:hypothetical protein
VIKEKREMDKKELIKRNLKGLPGNLALSYLSTTYNGNGLMSDWINYIAQNNEFTEIEVDILNKKVLPKEAESKPLLHSVEKLRGMIKSNLTKNGLDVSFITKAIMRFEIPLDDSGVTPEIYCFPFVEDETGEIYKGKKKIIGKTTENFNPKAKIETEENLLAQIKKAKNEEE